MICRNTEAASQDASFSQSLASCRPPQHSGPSLERSSSSSTSILHLRTPTLWYVMLRARRVRQLSSAALADFNLFSFVAVPTGPNWEYLQQVATSSACAWQASWQCT